MYTFLSVVIAHCCCLMFYCKWSLFCTLSYTVEHELNSACYLAECSDNWQFPCAQGRSQKFILGGYNFLLHDTTVLYTSSLTTSAAISTQNNFQGLILGGYIYRYTPVATPLLVPWFHVSGEYLWSPYGTGQALIFLPVVSFFFLFFHRLISAAADWMSTVLPHMVWP